MARIGLAGWSENWLWKLAPLFQTRGQRDAAYSAKFFIFHKSAAREPAAHHALDRNNLHAPANHAAPLQHVPLRLRQAWNNRRISGDHMVANNFPFAYAFKPFDADLREQLSLVGDHGGKNHVKCADAIGGDHDDSRTFARDCGKFIDVAHLANTFAGKREMRSRHALGGAVVGLDGVDLIFTSG